MWTDVDGDGNFDIFCAEMAKWTERAAQPDNPEAKMWIFYGDGKGNFTARVVAMGQGTHEGRVADLNGDGRLDLLLKPYNWDAPRLDVWLGAGGRSARRRSGDHAARADRSGGRYRFGDNPEDPRASVAR